MCGFGKAYNYNAIAACKKNSEKKGYCSGGLATIVKGKYIIRKDCNNSSRYILVSDLMLEGDD